MKSSRKINRLAYLYLAFFATHRPKNDVVLRCEAAVRSPSGIVRWDFSQQGTHPSRLPHRREAQADGGEATGIAGSRAGPALHNMHAQRQNWENRPAPHGDSSATLFQRLGF